MPANKYALLRYRIIDKCIRNKYKPYPSKNDLREACEDFLYNSFGERVSESTIEKDLYAMRNEEGLGYMAPIRYSRDFGGYYYEDEKYSIDDLPLNDEDIEAIRFAAMTLSQFRNVEVFSQFGSAIEKILDRVELSSDMEDDAIDQYVQFENTPIAKGSEYLSELLSAIKEKLVTRMTYRSYQAGVDSVREVYPLLLKEYRNRWYLAAFDPSAEKVKTYGLDRIRSLNIGESRFKKVDFNVEQFFRHSIGITSDHSNPEKVVIRFDAQQAMYITSQPIHPTQKVESRDENGLTISLNVIISPELTMQILSYGSKAEVLEPESLRNRITEELEIGLRKYESGLDGNA